MSRPPQPARRPLPSTDKIAAAAAAVQRFAGERAELSFLVDGAELSVKKPEDRANLLETYRAGGLTRLVFRDTPFIQRDTPNRNFVRFDKGILKAYATSFEGVPFLKNHDTHDTDSRGGTVLESKLVSVADGKAFVQLTEAVKPWAIESILDGTIDRFSVGWDRDGAAPLCSLHKTIVGDKCFCWRGDLVDGKRVEYLYTRAIGTEKSGVNVPAVVGTSVDSIGALSMVDRRAVLCILSGAGDDRPSHKEPKTMTIDPRLLALFGLSLTTENADDVVRAAERDLGALGLAKARIAELETAEAKRTAADAEAKLAAERAENERHAANVVTKLATLVQTGKILPGGDQETALRALPPSLFDATVKALESSTLRVSPVGAPLPAGRPDPNPQPPTGLASPPVPGMPQQPAIVTENPHLLGFLKGAGITQEQLSKHGGAAIAKVEERGRTGR